MSEEGEMASQSSRFYLTGVRGRTLRILYAPASIVRKALRETVLFWGLPGRADRSRHMERISHSQAPPCRLANVVLKNQDIRFSV